MNRVVVSATHPERASRRRLVASVAVLAPALVVLGTAVALTLSGGGYGAEDWYPATLLALALGAVVVVAGGRPTGGRWGSAALPLAALAAYALWCLLSITWAAIPSQAWDAGNRVILYLAILVVVTLRPWPPVAVRALLMAVVALLGVFTAALLIAFASSAHPESYFQVKRLAWPMGYANATAGLFVIGVPPAVWLACDRALPSWARGLALGVAGLLLETSLLCQSRGGVLSILVGALALLLAAPRRWAVLAAVVAVAVVVLAASSPVLTVLDASPNGFRVQLAGARTAIVMAAVALVFVGWVLALATDRIAAGIPARIGRHGDRAMAGLALLVVAGALVSMGDPATWVHDRWTDFKSSGYTKIDTSSSRLTGSLGSHRYDTYRVGIDEFLAHPVGGVGADGFGAAYLIHRRTDESPHYAHSLAVSLLGETGIVGAALFLAFLLLALRIVRRGLRALRPGGESGPTAGALAAAAVFLTGCMVDWLWQFTALGVLALALLGAAMRSGTELEAVTGSRTAPRWGRLPALAGGTATIAAVVCVALPGIAARFTASAYGTSATDPAAAIGRLDRAARYDPLSSGAPLAQGIILRRLGRLEAARAAFSEAINREPTNWFAWFERGMVESVERRWPAATADLAEAARRNPRQPVIGGVRTEVNAHRPAAPDRVEIDLSQQVTARLSPFG